jgi:SAM-dependent methyltransferase
MSLAGFNQLQTLENRLVAPLVGDAQPNWVLELAPVSSSSPALDCPRERILVNSSGACWPFAARLDALPLDSESVPLVLVRHLWQPGLAADPLSDVMRLLKPGGLLISVTANPWHRTAWQTLGKDALWLPSWPRWQWMHATRPMELLTSEAMRWKALVPGLSPVLVLVARKPRRPAQVRQIRFGRQRVPAAAAAVSHCRAA